MNRVNTMSILDRIHTEIDVRHEYATLKLHTEREASGTIRKTIKPRNSNGACTHTHTFSILQRWNAYAKVFSAAVLRSPSNAFIIVGCRRRLVRMSNARAVTVYHSNALSPHLAVFYCPSFHWCVRCILLRCME